MYILAVEFIIIGKEFFQTGISQGVFKQPENCIQRTGCYVSPGFQALNNVHGMTH